MQGNIFPGSWDEDVTSLGDNYSACHLEALECDGGQQPRLKSINRQNAKILEVKGHASPNSSCTEFYSRMHFICAK